MEQNIESKKKHGLKFIVLGTITAIGASLCCITPVLAVIAGLSGAASTFAWLDPFRPYLIALTLIILTFAWYQKLKPQIQEEISCDCETSEKPSFWQSKKFLGIITLIAILMLAFPYYSGIFFPDNESKTVIVNNQDLRSANLFIKGMTCTGCEHSVNYALKGIDGVISAESDYKEGIARVKFDIKKVSLEEMASKIKKDVGYTVIKKEVSKNDLKKTKDQ